MIGDSGEIGELSDYRVVYPKFTEDRVNSITDALLGTLIYLNKNKVELGDKAKSILEKYIKGEKN